MSDKERKLIAEWFAEPSAPISTVVRCLNYGRLGSIGAVSIHASKKGLRIAVNGRTMVKGKTPADLHTAFQALAEKAKRNSAD